MNPKTTLIGHIPYCLPYFNVQRRLLCHRHHRLHYYHNDYNYYQWCNYFGSSWKFLFFFVWCGGASSPSFPSSSLLSRSLWETQREAVVEELHHLYKPFFPKSQPLSPRTIPISFLSDKIIYWTIFPSHSHIWWASLILKTSNMTSWMVYLSVTVLYNSHQASYMDQGPMLRFNGV